MKIDLPSSTRIPWEDIPKTTTNGHAGFSAAKTFALGTMTFRQVTYSPDYLADHWCEKGHILQVLEGTLDIVYQDNKKISLSQGMTCVIGDVGVSHQAKTITGAIVLIID